ncbi:MAG: hypothetical protein LBP92_07390 [Deltaproteobacteria bacterium]|jgi:hypothetical protein|nr:hypothetical protein [Deltaproteobacteria bacterium]
MSAINEEMTFVSRDCKSILDICDKLSQVSQKILANDKTRLLDSGQLSTRLGSRDHDSELFAAARLQDVPVIARISCKDETNRTRIFYTCPCSPPSGIPRANLASIYSPLGRLAVLPLGATLATSRDGTLVVTDRAALRPADYRVSRDVQDTLFESLHRDRIRVKSLRDFLRVFGENRAAPALPEGEEPPLVPAEELDVVVDEGETRPQAIFPSLFQPHLMDLPQDDVMRRPFQARQFIVGPPGSGKTTTLIRRLDFMVAGEALEAEERGLPERLDGQSGQGHASSWYLFVPTDTLRQYLKDSFAHLVIPGSGENVLTWEEARIDLATSHFRILDQGDGQGLALARRPGRVSRAAMADTARWYSDFAAFQARAYYRSLAVQAGFLAGHDDGGLSRLGQQLLELLEKSSDHTLSWFRRALEPFQEAISELVQARTSVLRSELKAAFQAHTERDPALVAGLVSLSSVAGQAREPDPSQARFRAEAARVYASALIDQAVALAKGRRLGRDSLSSRVVAWLGEGRLLPADRLRELGADQAVCRALRRFKVDGRGFLDCYFDSIVPNYLLFRRRDRLWYQGRVGASRQVEPLEVDLLLLAFLESGAELLRHSGSPHETIRPNWSLQNQAYLSRNQVLADQASDFSPVQLKCMAALAGPGLGSVTVAGDLDLRTTPWGLRSLDDLEWALPKASLSELQVNYRQSRQLLDLSDSLSGSNRDRFSVSRFGAQGPRPALAQNCGGLQETALWLAARVAEIVSRAGRLPSTAVAVLRPSEAGPLAEALSRALEGQGLRALSCGAGQPLGRSADVRVLPLDQARGLEFEAFFLVVGGDAPAGSVPLGRLAYLAASRAATYLGLVFREALPDGLGNLASLSVASWSQPLEPLEGLGL